jgi:hypothetical protein
MKLRTFTRECDNCLFNTPDVLVYPCEDCSFNIFCNDGHDNWEPRNGAVAVAEFQTAMGAAIGLDFERDPDHRHLTTVVELQINLIQEETQETLAALRKIWAKLNSGTNPSQEDLVELLDGLADSRYVLNHCGNAFGFDNHNADLEVHRSNMSKLGEDGNPIRRPEDGKVLKGPNFTPPDLTPFV